MEASDKAQDLISKYGQGCANVACFEENWSRADKVAYEESDKARSALEEYIANLEATVKQAYQIFIPAKYAYRYVDPPPAECPHGNTPRYPTHAWWCDGCWLALEDALVALGFDITYPPKEKGEDE